MTTLPTDVEPDDPGHADLHNQTNAEINAATPGLSTNTLVRRDGSGWIFANTFAAANAPASDAELTRKDYVDDLVSAQGSGEAIGNGLVRRFPDASAAFSTVYIGEGAGNQATRRDYVDRMVMPRMVSGRWYGAPTPNSVSLGSNERVELTPLWVPRDVTLDRLMARVETAGEAGSVLRMGIYNSNADGDPATRLLDAGTAAADSAGVRTLTINVALTPGVYWLACVVQNAPTLAPVLNKCVLQSWPIGRTIADINGGQGGYQLTSSYSGALPASAGAISSYYDVNYVMARVA